MGVIETAGGVLILIPWTATYAAFALRMVHGEVLYEDPELGFCICGHVYGDAAVSQPHDHGSTCAIYGQARGRTEMTDWRIVEEGDGDGPALVEPVETYALAPGDVRLYDIGAVHSPKREQPTKLIRIEGQNLDHLKRSNIKAK